MKQELTRELIAGIGGIFIDVQPSIFCNCGVDCSSTKCHRLSNYLVRLSKIQANDLLSSANAEGETIMCEYNKERNVIEL